MQSPDFIYSIKRNPKSSSPAQARPSAPCFTSPRHRRARRPALPWKGVRQSRIRVSRPKGRCRTPRSHGSFRSGHAQDDGDLVHPRHSRGRGRGHLGLLYNRALDGDGNVRVQVADVAPQVSGQITEIRVVDNQYVHQGDVLYVIDPFDF